MRSPAGTCARNRGRRWAMKDTSWTNSLPCAVRVTCTVRDCVLGAAPARLWLDDTILRCPGPELLGAAARNSQIRGNSQRYGRPELQHLSRRPAPSLKKKMRPYFAYSGPYIGVEHKQAGGPDSRSRTRVNLPSRFRGILLHQKQILRKPPLTKPNTLFLFPASNDGQILS